MSIDLTGKNRGVTRAVEVIRALLGDAHVTHRTATSLAEDSLGVLEAQHPVIQIATTPATTVAVGPRPFHGSSPSTTRSRDRRATRTRRPGSRSTWATGPTAWPGMRRSPSSRRYIAVAGWLEAPPVGQYL